jgi:hypothetical protein
MRTVLPAAQTQITKQLKTQFPPTLYFLKKVTTLLQSTPNLPITPLRIIPIFEPHFFRFWGVYALQL